MALFLSTHVNKIDKKGRVSVPAQWRAGLVDQPFQGIILFPSSTHAALEGFAWSYMEDLSKRLDAFDLFSAEQDDLATAVFAQSVQLPFDGDGRIIMPQGLLEYAGLDERASFVGMGAKFQIWSPEALVARSDEARAKVRSGGLTIPKGVGE